MLNCPMCQRPIAAWVVRAEFTCHHCAWAIRSNIGQAFVWALLASLFVEIAVFIWLWCWLPQKMDFLGVWLALGGIVGYILGQFTFKVKMTLTPVRPQRAITGHADCNSGVSASAQR